MTNSSRKWDGGDTSIDRRCGGNWRPEPPFKRFSWRLCASSGLGSGKRTVGAGSENRLWVSDADLETGKEKLIETSYDGKPGFIDELSEKCCGVDLGEIGVLN